MVGWLNNVVGKMRKEADVTYLKLAPSIYFEGLRKPTQTLTTIIT
jgi:hypothetical protein